MIGATSASGGTVLDTDLPGGTVAYLDRDWIVADASAALPALLVEDGRVRWHTGAAIGSQQASGPDAAAGSALAAMASEAVAAVEPLTAGSLEVSGRGLVAHLVRRLLHARLRTDPQRALAAWIDTTGEPATITQATRQVGDLGTVVIAGETLGRGLALDVYKDVHVRGLRLVGVAPPPFPSSADAATGWPQPAAVRPGTPLPAAPWYRLVA